MYITVAVPKKDDGGVSLFTLYIRGYGFTWARCMGYGVREVWVWGLLGQGKAIKKGRG